MLRVFWCAEASMRTQMPWLVQDRPSIILLFLGCIVLPASHPKRSLSSGTLGPLSAIRAYVTRHLDHSDGHAANGLHLCFSAAL